jgi:hypothetical protein
MLFHKILIRCKNNISFSYFFNFGTKITRKVEKRAHRKVKTAISLIRHHAMRPLKVRRESKKYSPKMEINGDFYVTLNPNTLYKDV